MNEVPKAIEAEWKIDSTRRIAAVAARHRFAHNILDNIEIAGTPTVRHFSSVSLPYLPRCRQRTISHWDCHYRGAISHYLDYPGFRVIAAPMTGTAIRGPESAA
jgi:hypothetical protein